MLGLTYKPGTDTLRRSGAVELAAKLLAAGATVRCYDPVVRDLPPELTGATLTASLADAVRAADAAVVATEWPQIKEAGWATLLSTMHRRVLIDANGFLKLRAEDAEYFAVGTPTH